MIIRDLEFHRVKLPRHGTSPQRWSLLVELMTDTGLSGWGEAPLAWRTEELAQRRVALLPTLDGRNIFDVTEMRQLQALEDPLLASALEMASWDLIGKTLGQPICRLWGGAYRQQVPLAVRISKTSPLETLASELSAAGIAGLVVELTGETQQDLANLSLLRSITGGRSQIYLDGAGNLNMEAVRSFCKQLSSEDVAFLCDPLADASLSETASLIRQTQIRVGVGRNLDRPSDVVDAARADACHLAVIDPARVGGMTNARRCACVADAAGMLATLSIGQSIGIAFAAMLQVVAATPCLASPNLCHDVSPGDALFKTPPELIDGMVSVPQNPGLGIEIDPVKLESLV